MATSHIINIEDCGSGSYTKVRKQLNKSLGGPEAWDYDKPMFTVACSSEEFEKLQDKLSGIDGIAFMENHGVVEVVSEIMKEIEAEEAEEAEAEAEAEEAEEQVEESASDEPTPLQKLLARFAWKK